MDTNTHMIDSLLDICRKHIISDKDPLADVVVLCEPYIPYLPPKWNGCLVLAESQNLGNPEDGYVKELKGRTSDQRLKRLGSTYADFIGVQPWDDCTLKLAVEAALGLKAEETAVSNAVVWSQSAGRTNANPSSLLQQQAIGFWKDMLAVLQPIKLVACGKIAEFVVRGTRDSNSDMIFWRLPAPTGISRVSGMFPDILKRYPEVEKVVRAHPEWESALKTYRQNKVFYACHAVSICKSKGSGY